jgi:hypothetical protein
MIDAQVREIFLSAKMENANPFYDFYAPRAQNGKHCKVH